MHPLDLIAYFVGGGALMNAVPHIASGAMGRPFPTPFAKPPGWGLSSPVVNVLWGLANVVLAYLLLVRVGAFDLRSVADVLAAMAGMAVVGVGSAYHFGGLGLDGRGPGPG